MQKCDSANPMGEACNAEAVVILSVGSLGRVEKLCSAHRMLAQQALDVNLVPYQVTGIEASYSPEQALANDLANEEEASDVLREQLHRLEGDNAALRDRLEHQIRLTNETLRDRIAQLEADNAALRDRLEREPVTRVD